ncbi:MAG: hypothetical protein ACYTF6_08535 [Planctomycetota bacterium]|jgi:hypothetical protein
MASSRSKPNQVVVIFLLAAGFLAPAPPAMACSTPVFRYALENWSAEAYRVVIFHREKLSAEQQQAVAYLRDSEQTAAANVMVDVADVSGHLQQHMAKLWKDFSGAELPLMVVSYPPRGQFGWTPQDAPERPALPPVVWSAPVTMAAAKALVESPLRKSIAGRILEGETAVWVLVECGDRKADEAAAKLLKQELAKMPSVLELDPYAAEEVGEGGPPLKIAFSLVRLKAGEKNEAVLLAMLLGLERDLKALHKNQPMAFAVYGRGRALEPLVGKGINKKNIHSECSYLTAPCSCQIKWDNRGTDLLIEADWDAAFPDAPVTFIAPPPVMSLGGIAEELEPATQPADDAANDDGTSPAGDSDETPGIPSPTTKPAGADPTGQEQEGASATQGTPETPGRSLPPGQARGAAGDAEDSACSTCASGFIPVCLLAAGTVLLIVVVGRRTRRAA